MKDEKEIDFIASNYREGVFDAEAALRRIKPTRRIWTAARIAAACVVIIVISATAAVFVNKSRNDSEPQPVETAGPSVTPASSQMVKAIDFEDTPLPAVVDRIQEVYGVEVGNLPEDAAEYRLSLHYEGTAADLIDTVNDILNTEMSISQ